MNRSIRAHRSRRHRLNARPSRLAVLLAPFILLPLSFGISVIYKSMRLPRLERFWQQVAFMTTQIILAMVALAIGLAVLIQIVIPVLSVD